jgi:hypothetical protein
MTTIPNNSAVVVTPPDGDPYEAMIISLPVGKSRLYTVLADGRAWVVPEEQLKEIENVC